MITGGAAMMLMGFVMFFVFSVVLSMSPEQLAMAQAENISVLSYLANVHESPLISLLGPLVAFAAIHIKLLRSLPWCSRRSCWSS